MHHRYASIAALTFIEAGRIGTDDNQPKDKELAALREALSKGYKFVTFSPDGVYAIFEKPYDESHLCEAYQNPPNPPTYQCAAENPLFSHEQTALVRMVKFKEPVACALCGSKRKDHWTRLVPFRAFDMDDRIKQPTPLTLDTKSGPLLWPLTPVCNDHLLAEDAAVMTEMIEAFHYFFNLTVKRLKREAKEPKKP